MFCNNCGNEIANGGSFCPACGAPVQQSASPAEYAPDNYPQNNYYAQYGNAPDNYGASYSAQMNTAVQSPAKKGKSKKPIIIIASIAAAIAAIAVIVLIVMGVKSATNEREMEEAIATHNVKNVVEAYGDSQYSSALNEFIEEATATLNNDFEYDGIGSVEQAVFNFISDNWGDIFYTEKGKESALWKKANISKASGSKTVEFSGADALGGLLLEFDAMRMSKVAYYEAVDMIEHSDDEDNFLEAIRILNNNMLPEDKNYSNLPVQTDKAFTAYVAAVSDKIDAYIYAEDHKNLVAFVEEFSDRLIAPNDFNDEIAATRKKNAEIFMEKADEERRNGDSYAASGYVKAAAAIYPDGGYEAELTD